jgi:inner membrane protein
MQEPSFFDRATHWLKTSTTVRLFTIGFILLLLLIPIELVQDLIRERQGRQNQAVYDIASSWGQAQELTGPILVIPFEKTELLYGHINNTQEEKKTTLYASFLPDELDYSGTLLPETNHRGIYDVNVYTADLNVKGAFPKPHMSEWDEANVVVRWDKAQVVFGITDLAGVNEAIVLNINGIQLPFNPGLEEYLPVGSGVITDVDISPETEELRFSTHLLLRGTRAIEFSPLGKVTNVELNSTWKDPSFFGDFSPDDKKVAPEAEGFYAHWNVLHLNRSIPQKFIGQHGNLRNFNFGVSLFDEVNDYHKTERTAKYAVLFIALTFMTFFFAQILNKVRIHGLQFVMVGLALCVFYVLLLSLSEHLGFDLAYLIASLGIIIQITLYVMAIFKSRKLGFTVLGILAGLYLFIYTIIRMAEYSLLMGSIGLFIALAIMMYLSRNIDWSNLKRPTDAE